MANAAGLASRQTPVAENQDAVEHVAVEGAKFATGVTDPPAFIKPGAGIQKPGATLRQKHDHERSHDEVRSVHAGSERDEEQDGGKEKEETGGDLKPERRASIGVGTCAGLVERTVRGHRANAINS